MQKVTRYVANDSNEFETAKECIEHDATTALINEIIESGWSKLYIALSESPNVMEFFVDNRADIESFFKHIDTIDSEEVI